MGKGTPEKCGSAGDAQGRAGALGEDIGVSPSFAGRDGDVPVQTADGGKNQSAEIQRPSGGSNGVCECDKQTEHPWSACQKAPSVTVTWGWGSCVLTADLGNNARRRYKQVSEINKTWINLIGHITVLSLSLLSEWNYFNNNLTKLTDNKPITTLVNNIKHTLTRYKSHNNVKCQYNHICKNP